VNKGEVELGQLKGDLPHLQLLRNSYSKNYNMGFGTKFTLRRPTKGTKMPATETILIVDDTENIRNIFLAAFEEYQIIAVSSGQEALAVLNKPNDIALIVLDVMMPGINGLELLREIKKLNPKRKVVIMTAYSSKDIAIEALRLDADDYVEKPFDINDVKVMFDRLLKEAGSLNGANSHVQNNKLQLAQRLVKRNYNRRFSLQDASKEVFLSYKYLSRVFKEKTGKGFSKYRQELKINSAKQLLKESSDSVAQIAYRVGYLNPDSFMKMFKRVTGTTPSEFRANINSNEKSKKK
jgi:two-component system, response regulator YesN